MTPEEHQISDLEGALEKQRKDSHERYMKLLDVFNTALDSFKTQLTGFAGGAWGPSQVDEEGRVWARHYRNGVEDCRILLHEPEKV